VLGIVADYVRKAADQRGSVVIVAHSLGSIVRYDVFDLVAREIEVDLLVTAGSPLGFPVVLGALRPSGAARGAPAARGGRCAG
jgi:endonuclease G, mitochondrial